VAGEMELLINYTFTKYDSTFSKKGEVLVISIPGNKGSGTLFWLASI
jgi:hypothetical protein